MYRYSLNFFILLTNSIAECRAFPASSCVAKKTCCTGRHDVSPCSGRVVQPFLLKQIFLYVPFLQISSHGKMRLFPEAILEQHSSGRMEHGKIAIYCGTYRRLFQGCGNGLSRAGLCGSALMALLLAIVLHTGLQTNQKRPQLL